MQDLITTAEIWKEGGMYTSYCPELDIASCGNTPEEARKNLQEVIRIQLEETAKLGTLDDLLSESGYTRDGDVMKTGKKIICFEEIRTRPSRSSGQRTLHRERKIPCRYSTIIFRTGVLSSSILSICGRCSKTCLYSWVQLRTTAYEKRKYQYFLLPKENMFIFERGWWTTQRVQYHAQSVV